MSGIGDLADVVQRRGEIDVAAEPRRQAELLGDDAAVAGDPQRVLAGVVVAVFDREREPQDDLLLALAELLGRGRDRARQIGGTVVLLAHGCTKAHQIAQAHRHLDALWLFR